MSALVSQSQFVVPVRPIFAHEQESLGAIIGESFSDDPVARWTLKTPHAISATYTVLCQQVYFPRGACTMVDAMGGAMWLRPLGCKDMSLWAQLSHAARLFKLAGARSIARALVVDAIMKKKRPKEEHFYLFALGVLPQRRGRGIARALITHMTDEADQASLPCWLENSNPRNESLYRGMGFEPVETFSPAPGCPPMTTMLRIPRGEQK